jgi:hypothetical protein
VTQLQGQRRQPVVAQHQALEQAEAFDTGRQLLDSVVGQAQVAQTRQPQQLLREVVEPVAG